MKRRESSTKAPDATSAVVKRRKDSSDIVTKGEERGLEVREGVRISVEIVVTGETKWITVPRRTSWSTVRDRFDNCSRLLYVHLDHDSYDSPRIAEVIGPCATVSELFYGACARKHGYISVLALPILGYGGAVLDHFHVQPIPDMSARCRLEIYGFTYAYESAVRRQRCVHLLPEQKMGFSFGAGLDLECLKKGLIWRSEWLCELNGFDVPQPVRFEVHANPQRGGRGQLFIQEQKWLPDAMYVISMAGAPRFYNLSVVQTTRHGFAKSTAAFVLPLPIIDMICEYAKRSESEDDEIGSSMLRTIQGDPVHVDYFPSVCVRIARSTPTL